VGSNARLLRLSERRRKADGDRCPDRGEWDPFVWKMEPGGRAGDDGWVPIVAADSGRIRDDLDASNLVDATH
jgi:hypothetical protein